jgi:hypothetical protein
LVTQTTATSQSPSTLAVTVMRPFLIIGLFVLSQWAAAQSYCDTIVKHVALDKLKRAVITNTARVDSTENKDSLTITYFSKANEILEQEIHHFRGKGCTYNKSTTYFNNKNLPEFIEHFEQPCLTEDERKDEDLFEKLIYWYERFEYDSHNRVAVKVRWYPTVKTRRFEYIYDNDGKRTEQSRRIKEDQFWD